MDGWMGRKKNRVGGGRDTSAIEAAGKETKNIQQKKKKLYRSFAPVAIPVAQRHMAHFDGWWWWLLLVDIYIKRKV